MTVNRIEIEIKRAAGDVYPYISEFSKLRRWLRGLLQQETAGTSPNGESYDFLQTLSADGSSRSQVYLRFLAKQPPNKVEFEGWNKLFTLHGLYEIEDLSEGRCRVRYTLTTELGWTLKMFAPFIRQATQKKLEDDFRGLKALVEDPTPRRTAHNL